MGGRRDCPRPGQVVRCLVGDHHLGRVRAALGVGASWA